MACVCFAEGRARGVLQKPPSGGASLHQGSETIPGGLVLGFLPRPPGHLGGGQGIFRNGPGGLRSPRPGSCYGTCLIRHELVRGSALDDLGIPQALGCLPASCMRTLLGLGDILRGVVHAGIPGIGQGAGLRDAAGLLQRECAGRIFCFGDGCALAPGAWGGCGCRKGGICGRMVCQPSLDGLQGTE